MKGIEDKVVVVTGASAGIGQAAAVQLARRGAHVVLTARRKERLQQLADNISEAGGRCLVIPGDIQQEAFAGHLMDRAVDEFGRIDVLINNAGLGHFGRLADLSSEDTYRVMNTNIMGPLYTIRAAVPHMRRQGQGQIVNVSSVVSQRPLPNTGIYCASKSALNFLSRSLRMELYADNITVTIVYPGRTESEFGIARLGNRPANPSRTLQVPADRVGRAIVRAVQYQRTEVYVTLFDYLFTNISRLFPLTTDWLAIRLAGRYQ